MAAVVITASHVARIAWVATAAPAAPAARATTVIANRVCAVEGTAPAVGTGPIQWRIIYPDCKRAVANIATASSLLRFTGMAVVFPEDEGLVAGLAVDCLVSRRCETCRTRARASPSVFACTRFSVPVAIDAFTLAMSSAVLACRVSASRATVPRGRVGTAVGDKATVIGVWEPARHSATTAVATATARRRAGSTADQFTPCHTMRDPWCSAYPLAKRPACCCVSDCPQVHDVRAAVAIILVVARCCNASPPVSQTERDWV